MCRTETRKNERRTRTMTQKIYLGLCAVVVGFAVACGETTTPVEPSAATSPGIGAAADGSTLKIAAPTLISPTGNFQPDPGSAVVLTLRNVSGTFKTFPVTYEIEIYNSANVRVANTKAPASSGTNTSIPVAVPLQANSPHTWKARATYGNSVGPWSLVASFRSPVEAFISGRQFFDPLTTGKTVGKQRGGHFIAGVGWQALGNADGIDYDIDTCDNCRLEF